MERGRLLDIVAAGIEGIRCPHPLRVAIDGIDGAGKTVFADELAAVLGRSSRQIIRASVDDFHRPKAERYRRGRFSPEGYYHDAFDYPRLVRCLLEPLGSSGTRRVRTRIFNHRRDTTDLAGEEAVVEDAILLLDGVFLQRGELAAHLDHSIHLKVEREEALQRAARRDPASSVSRDDPLNRRYIEAHAIYFEEWDPEANADVLVLNHPIGDPKLLR